MPREAIRTFIKPDVGVYRALLTQEGTSAPVATVLQNTTGEEVVWTRQQAGKYQATLNSNSRVTNTTAQISMTSGLSNTPISIWLEADGDVRINTFAGGNTLSDEMLWQTTVEILIYNNK